MADPIATVLRAKLEAGEQPNPDEVMQLVVDHEQLACAVGHYLAKAQRDGNVLLTALQAALNVVPEDDGDDEDCLLDGFDEDEEG